MPKLPTNLSVDPAVMERARQYGVQHDTSVSQLVGDFLANLPDDEAGPEFSPTVALLYGIAAPARQRQTVDRADPVEVYHQYLETKYGSKRKKK